MRVEILDSNTLLLTKFVYHVHCRYRCRGRNTKDVWTKQTDSQVVRLGLSDEGSLELKKLVSWEDDQRTSFEFNDERLFSCEASKWVYCEVDRSLRRVVVGGEKDELVIEYFMLE